jgi:excisionase family DNA binding protein
MSTIGVLWTIDDVAAFARVSRRTVKRRVADGTLPTVSIGPTVRFDPLAVRAALGVELPAHEAAVVAALVAELGAREVVGG